MADDNIVFSDDAPPPMSSSPTMQDADEDGEVCRICRVSGSTDDPLRYPCLCRGSIKYMHEACLYQWLSVNHKAICEVCGHAFSFSPVYADNTPSRIPIYEIVAWGATKIPSLLLSFLRVACFIFVWFFIVPFTTLKVWRLTLMTTLAEGWALLLDYRFTFRDSLVGLLCFWGKNYLRFICYSLMMYFRRPIRLGHRIDVFADEMAEVVAGQLEIQRQRGIVAELYGIEGSIYRFLKHVLLVLAENATMALVLVFVPNYLGRTILYSTITSNLYAIVIGYIPILGLGLIYLGRKEIKGLVGALLSFNRKFLLGTEPLMMGNMGTGRAVLYFWREFLVAISPVMTLLKVAAFLVIKLLVFSFVLGCLLDACTMEIWGISMEDKIEGFCGHPLRSSMYYFVLGLCYMFLVSNLISHIEKALHTSLPILLWDIRHRIPNLDLIRTLSREPLSYLSLRLLLSISCDSIPVVILMYLPVTLAVRLTPSIFPLELIFPDIIHSILEFAVLLFVYIPFVEDHVRDFNFGDTVSAIKHWVSGVVWAVGLANFSVAISQGVIGREGIGNATIGDESIRNENYCREVSLISCKGETLNTFLRWIILMLFLAWNTVLLNTIMLILPVLIGRAVLNAIPHPEELNVIWHNDLYTISTGWYIMWKCIAIAIKVAQCIKDCDVLLGSEILKMCSSVLKHLTLYFMWITVAPLLFGLLLDLATAPLIVPMDATQILFWHIDWAYGLICFNIWLFMVECHMIQDSETLQRLRANLILWEQHGLSQLTWSSAISETIFPIISFLLTGLCFPYVFAKGIFPLFGYSLVANSKVHLYSWLGFLLLFLVCRWVPVWAARVNNLVKNDLYVVGWRVDNYDG
ncbi:hypothetical protein LUZ63_006283 [Rhynchospora breviuscula]|uniref:RING-CH-type domain-containing protein n=1 Tax=Rhynchospora breviuscula TaxID=2022672 RepID=A0A9Q0CPR3_9POAL|nr:hypothetical protein LUZ63_006283 [Rhynchospora breviuscula]